MSARSGSGTGAPGQPLLRVIRGTPDDAELAALTSVVLAAAAGAGRGERPSDPAAAAARRSAWADRAALMRHTPHPGAGAWRASGMPFR